MKKYFLLLVFTFQLGLASEEDSLVPQNTSIMYQKFFRQLDDCDACGCSASGGSMGFASMLNSNFVGLRYFYQSYSSSDGLYSNSPWYDENFNTIQVWARIPVVTNFQISALIPYNFHNRQTETGSQSISGIGDLTVIGMYTLYQTHKDSTFLVHSLQLGGGIKAPLGKFDQANNGSVNPSYQVGTGSWDYFLATEYIVRRKQFGINAMLNYIIKTENKNNYQFGNQLNYAATLFYLYEKDQLSFAPQLGFSGELYQSNYQMGQELKDTAGDIFFGKIGFEVGKDKLSMGINAMLPINQNLTGGNVEANYRWSVNLNYGL